VEKEKAKISCRECEFPLNISSHRTAILILFTVKVSEDLISSVEQLHTHFDKDGDGYLNEEEFAALKNSTSSEEEFIGFTYICQLVDADASMVSTLISRFFTQFRAQGVSSLDLLRLYSLCAGRDSMIKVTSF